MNWLHWSLLSAFFAGLTAVLAKAGVCGIDANLATAVRTSIVLPLVWGIAFAVSKPSDMSTFSGNTWMFLVFSGLATGLSWLCYFQALRVGQASQVAPVDKLSVVFVIILAAIFLKEKMGIQQLIGGGFIAAGAVILAWKTAKP